MSYTDFSNLVVPTPISIPMDHHIAPGSRLNINPAVLNLPGTNTQGADIMTQLQFSLKASINLDWCKRTLLHFSRDSNTSFMINQPWALEYLLEDLRSNFDKTSALTLRNLSQDSDFTQLLASNPRTKKILLEVLENFQDDKEDKAVEETDPRFKNIDDELLIYTVDIVESVSSYYAPLPKNDDLFLSLSQIFLQSNDRSLVISLMRSFARFLVRSETTEDNCASNFTSPILDRVASFLLTNDYDLILTSLDFLYQYSLPGIVRVSHLLRSTTRQDILRSSLPKLLTFQQNVSKNPNNLKSLQPMRLVKRTKPPVPETAPKLLPEHYRQISLLPEPLRATAWMRCCYKFVPTSDVTQISLWKAYEQQFEKDITKKKLLPAVDFIKNVSQAFNNSSAMVINLPNGQRRFIIKGIEPRQVSVDIKTGDLEAFGHIKPKEENEVVSAKSVQEPVQVYVPPTTLNDVNSSAVMLLTSLTNNPQGAELFKPDFEELMKCFESFPVLFDELVDVFKYLQD